MECQSGRPPRTKEAPVGDSLSAGASFTLTRVLELSASSDQRIGLIGQTRMGKTFLMEHLAESQPRVIVVDSKHRVKWRRYHLTSNPIATFLQDRVIYRPAGGKPPREWWGAAVQSLAERGGGIIYIDELAFVCGPNTIDPGLADAFRLGGELGVGIWYSAQETTTVHNTTLRQAAMLACFFNQGASDRDKLAAIIGDMGYATAHLHKYQFVVYVQGETYDHDAIPVYEVATNDRSNGGNG